MCSIVPVSYPDRGFANLGPAADSMAQGLLNYLTTSGHYESETSAGDIWIRYRRRHVGFPHPYVRFLGSIGPQDTLPTSLDWCATLDTTFRRFRREFETVAESHSLVQSVQTASEHTFLYHLDSALTLCPWSTRERFLCESFLPAFRTRFPQGTLVFLGVDSELERRSSVLRVANYMQINGQHAFSQITRQRLSPRTAWEMQPTGGMNIDALFTAVLGNSMPLRTFLVGGNLDLRVLYFFGDNPRQIIDRGPFPRSFSDLLGSQLFMAGDATGLEQTPSARGGWLGRFQATTFPADEDIIALAMFLITKINYYVDNAFEPCNYRGDNDEVNFVDGFETHLTINRLLHECMQLVTTSSPAEARFMTFSVLDKYQELCRFTGRQPQRNFHYFCSRPFLNAVLLPAFGDLPAPWNDHFSTVATSLYNDLYDAVRNRGLWDRQVVQPSGFRPNSTWDATTHRFVPNTNIITEDDFAGEYVRVVRNTHHGFVSDNDRRRRFACTGSLITGYLPDSFTQLPLLILLADLLRPHAMIGNRWYVQNDLQLVP